MASRPDGVVAVRALGAHLGLSRHGGRLVATRFAALVLCLAPTYLVSREAIAAGVGRMPGLEDPEQPLELGLVAVLLRQVGGQGLSFAVLGMMAFIWLDWGLTHALCTRRQPNDHDSLRALLADGHRHSPPLARLSALTLVLGVLLCATCEWGFGMLRGLGTRQDWSGQSMLVTLPALEGLTIAVVLGLLGAASLCGQVILTRDRRTWAARALLEGTRLAAGMGRGLLLLVLAPWALQALGAALLVPLFPPALSVMGDALWLAYLASHCLLWHALLYSVGTRYAQPRFDGVRVRAALPLAGPQQLIGRLRSRWRRVPRT